MPVSGVRMSENRITPSGLNARHGCSDTSTCTHACRSEEGHSCMMCVLFKAIYLTLNIHLNLQARHGCSDTPTRTCMQV